MAAATYTDQQMLDQLRFACMQIATKGADSYTINGRMVTSLDLSDMQAAIIWLEQRIDAQTQPGIGGGTLLVGFDGSCW